MPRQSACAVAGAAGACAVWPRFHRGTAHRCLPRARVPSRAMARLGTVAAYPRFHLLLSAVGDDREPCAGLCAPTGRHAALAVMGLCGGRGTQFCRHAADLGSVHRNFDANVPPSDGLPELDLIRVPSCMHGLTRAARLTPLAGLVNLVMHRRFDSTALNGELPACGL